MARLANRKLSEIFVERFVVAEESSNCLRRFLFVVLLRVIGDVLKRTKQLAKLHEKVKFF